MSALKCLKCMLALSFIRPVLFLRVYSGQFNMRVFFSTVCFLACGCYRSVCVCVYADDIKLKCRM